ncbi:ANTAR domain-containing protein [Streptomyces sp. NPDC058739]|uniref:ANTAR domain-containing protein n=1 Tax=Streptomyces sp. NPDC058739 TaxID=3346618 RepID=UPI00368552AA
MAFFSLSPSRPLTLLSATDLAAENERLRAEAGQLQRAVTSHALVDQAIGAVVVLGRIPPEEAWRVLRDVSQRTNVKLSTVAAYVMDFAQGAELPEDVRAELHSAIARYADCGGRRKRGQGGHGDRRPAPSVRRDCRAPADPSAGRA